jgi:uncharacterized protein YjbI with pentapeptide repeats
MADEANDERRKALREALEKCSETVNRAMLSLLAVSLFCLLTTFGATDRSLVAPEASIKVPFTETNVSFVGFLIVAPFLLVVLTIYLHLFYGYWRELDTARRAQGLTETYPALFSLDRRLGRLLTAFIFYWLAPLVLATITWKAAARFEWGLPVAVVTVLLTAGLVFLQAVRRGPGRSRRAHALSLGLIGLLMLAAVTVGVATYVNVVLHIGLRQAEYWERPLSLFRADLKAAWLMAVRLRGADLGFANLEGAVLAGASLSGADLYGANLSRANLSGADLSGANLTAAAVTAADLSGANLSRAILGKADLNNANLSRANLNKANLFSANLRAAKLGGANLLRANLARADLTGADLTGADLTGADLSGATLVSVSVTCGQIQTATRDEKTIAPPWLDCAKN